MSDTFRYFFSSSVDRHAQRPLLCTSHVLHLAHASLSVSFKRITDKKTHTHTSYIYRKKIPKFRDALPRTTAGGFEVDHARFYFACIVSALEYVHSLGVAYRVSSSQCDERTMFGRAP